MTLIAGCEHASPRNACRVLHDLNDRYRRIFLRTEGGDRNVAAEHTEIATLAVRREIEPACDSLRNHIQRTGANLYNYLRRAGRRCPTRARRRDAAGRRHRRLLYRQCRPLNRTPERSGRTKS